MRAMKAAKARNHFQADGLTALRSRADTCSTRSVGDERRVRASGATAGIDIETENLDEPDSNSANGRRSLTAHLVGLASRPLSPVRSKPLLSNVFGANWGRLNASGAKPQTLSARVIKHWSAGRTTFAGVQGERSRAISRVNLTRVRGYWYHSADAANAHMERDCTARYRGPTAPDRGKSIYRQPSDDADGHDVHYPENDDTTDARQKQRSADGNYIETDDECSFAESDAVGEGIRAKPHVDRTAHHRGEQ